MPISLRLASLTAMLYRLLCEFGIDGLIGGVLAPLIPLDVPLGELAPVRLTLDLDRTAWILLSLCLPKMEEMVDDDFVLFRSLSSC